MKKKVFAGLAVGMMMFGVVGVANANLLTNGSFEDGDFSGGPVSADVGSTIIPGWTVVNGQLNTVSTWNPWGLAASDGIDFLDLTSYDDSAPYGGITQAITTTVGQQYTFSFDLDNPWSNGPVSVNASVGGISQEFAIASGTSWQTFSFDFMANSANTSFTIIGMQGYNYIGLDKVSVDEKNAPVPEPATLLLMGTGLAGLVGAYIANQN